MKNYKELLNKRITALSLCALLLFGALFVVFYPLAEAGHDCCGEECHICACIQLCESLLHKAADLPVPQMLALTVLSFLRFSVSVPDAYHLRETLVSQKIRLNN